MLTLAAQEVLEAIRLIERQATVNGWAPEASWEWLERSVRKCNGDLPESLRRRLDAVLSS